jgi:hypothetical protein
MSNNNTLPLNPQPSRRLLPESEAIEYLGLVDRPNPQGALRWLMRKRNLAYVRLAKGIYGFRQNDLDAFIQSKLVASGIS